MEKVVSVCKATERARGEIAHICSDASGTARTCGQPGLITSFAVSDAPAV